MWLAGGPGGTAPTNTSPGSYRGAYICGIGSLDTTEQSKPLERRTRAKARQEPRQSPSGDSWSGRNILLAPSSQLLIWEYSGMDQAGTRSSTTLSLYGKSEAGGTACEGSGATGRSLKR